MHPYELLASKRDPGAVKLIKKPVNAQEGSV